MVPTTTGTLAVLMDPRLRFHADQAAAAGEQIGARAEAVGARGVGKITNAIADLVRVLVADGQIGCPHRLPARAAWPTTAKILMHGHLCCIALARIVAVYLVEQGLPPHPPGRGALDDPSGALHDPVECLDRERYHCAVRDFAHRPH